MKRPLLVARLGLFALALLIPTAQAAASKSGATIYRKLCVECHGPKGEGVAGKYDEPLYGEKSVEALARLIDRTMPEDDPKRCVGDDARAVAAYLHDAFYSPEARARNHPVKVNPSRLTERQFRESVADLIGSFRPVRQTDRTGGLHAEYFQSKGMSKKEKKILQRVDSAIDFDFGEGSPVPEITPDQFSIAWSGSLVAPETGVYHLRLSTPNGARVYLNSDSLDGASNHRDDSDAKRQQPVIDLWVSSGADLREGVAQVFLLGGRSYSLKVDFFKFKDKRASVRLEWKPPHGPWSAIPRHALSAESSSRVAVVGTPFPADDGSAGYERGTAISKEWDQAVTQAAIEAANEVVARLDSLSGVREDQTNRVEKLKEFAATFVERAIRRPLTPDLRELMVDRPFGPRVDPESAIKRVVLLTLKSPRFLYPDLGSPNDDAAVATRLALALWDSLPDEELRQAAVSGRLRTPEDVRVQAERMLDDRRARTKMVEFFHHWLAIDAADDVTRDPKAYPGFSPEILGDLRTSLERFVDHVVWSDGSDYRQLLLADYVFLNHRLGEFYGTTAPQGEDFEPVAFESAHRAGILTHPFLLTVFSYYRSSSPIHRGVFLTRNVLGRFLKPPPMAIEFMDDRFDASLTMREKVTELTSKPACLSCHATINPLGFSLEHFDAVGRYRTLDNRKPVNAESEYTTGSGERLTLRGARDLAEHAASSPEARRGFVRQLFQHTVKQAPAAYGPDTLKRLDTAFAEGGHNIRKLQVEIAVTSAFNPTAANTATRR
jgi:cytochrome c553